MYDLASPIMKTQFNLINKSNQSIKLSVDISDKSSNKKDLKKYSYNKICIFKYFIDIANSKYNLKIYLEKISKNHFNKSVLGSFIYDNSIKYSISQISINVSKGIDLNALVFGFLQKDFIYSKYKINSPLKKFKSNFKLSNHYLSLLNSKDFRIMLLVLKKCLFAALFLLQCFVLYFFRTVLD